MSQKKLIIIPGSCSHKANWFDQIACFEAQGYEVIYVKPASNKYKNFSECADNLFHKLGSYLSSDETPMILAHSMGSMLLIKILSEFQYYQAKDKELYERIRKSKIIFLQMPLNLHKRIYFALNVFKYLAAPIQLVHSLLFVELFAWLLTYLKRLVFDLKRLKSMQFLKQFFIIIDLILNQALILNGVMGTKPWEFFNLVRYYKQFGKFTLSGFFIDDNVKAQNYYFSYGDPDYFCEVEATHKLAEYLGSQLLYMPLNMHNPQHLFWCQDKLHNFITEI